MCSNVCMRKQIRLNTVPMFPGLSIWHKMLLLRGAKWKVSPIFLCNISLQTNKQTKISLTGLSDSLVGWESAYCASMKTWKSIPNTCIKTNTCIKSPVGEQYLWSQRCGHRDRRIPDPCCLGQSSQSENTSFSERLSQKQEDWRDHLGLRTLAPLAEDPVVFHSHPWLQF